MSAPQIHFHVSAPDMLFSDGEQQPVFIKGAFATVASTDSNKVLITAVSGKVLRVISLVAASQSTTDRGQIALKDGSGGSTLFSTYIPPVCATQPPFVLPPNPYGWVDTTAGAGLYADGAGQNMQVCIRYIEFTPQSG